MALLTKEEFLAKYNDDTSGLYRTGQSFGIGSDDHREQIQDMLDSMVWPEDRSVTDFSMTNALPSSPSVGSRHRIVLPSPFTPVQIGNVFYNHFDIIEYTSGLYWIRYENDTSDQ